MPAKGSSSSINSGLAANALAISTRLLSPPERETEEVSLNFLIWHLIYHSAQEQA